MKLLRKILLIPLFLFLNGCITPFIPRTSEDKKILVVEGLITDQPDTNIIKLSNSLPLGTRNVANPLKGCIVTISDDLGNTFSFTETAAGIYVTDPSKFQGVVGRFYTLHITIHVANNNLHYESYPMEMKHAPPIDSLYYEKVAIQENNGVNTQEGCQVYLNTHDPANQSKFYRWEYAETWEFHIPYIFVPNRICWLSNNSDVINIKNTSVLEEDRIDRYPLNFVSNATDRLNIKYSILVNQYSLNEDEYLYWEKLQNITQQVGGLYDIIPSIIPSNVYSIDDPNEKVLGYFSVSGRSSKRLFIKDHFSGMIDLYTRCNGDTIFNGDPIPYLNLTEWVIIEHHIPPPYYDIITYDKGCADCSVRGTIIMPDFWNEGR